MNILAFAPHPDDVVIGMGGTLARHSDNGDNTTIINFTTFPERDADRRTEAKNAASLLNSDIEFLDFQPEEIEYSRSFVGICDEIIDEFAPDIIYTCWVGDSHQDHRNVTNSLLASTRKNQCSLYMYEIMLPGGITADSFSPQLYTPVTDYADEKFEALKAHESQYERYGDQWINGIRGRMLFRGSQINAEYAEAFEVVKQVRSNHDEF